MRIALLGWVLVAPIHPTFVDDCVPSSPRKI